MLSPLQRIRSNRKIQLLILLVFSATLINITYFFLLMKENNKSIKSIRLEEQASSYTRAILSTIKDAELGQRGYMVTGRKVYLAPYNGSVKTLPKLQQTLTALIKTHFGQQDIRVMDSLNHTLAIKLEELRNTIRLREQHREERMLDVVNSDLGEHEMHKIRLLCDRLLKSFRKANDADQQNISATLVKREISVVLFSILVITAVLVMRFKIRKRDRRNARLFEEMELQNLKLIRQQQELKNLNTQFSSRNTELEHFTHIISHDLRGPLTNIISLINILEDEDYSKENNAAFKMLKNSSAGLFHRLDDLIILLRHNQGGMLLKEQVSLSQLLAEVKANYKMEIERSGTMIEADFGQSDEVLFVKIYMQSILQNLISNAIKYRDHDRQNCITLKTYREEGMLRIIVKDNGQGIDMDKYGRDIFGLFKTFHTSEDSHGVGLYLVKKQVVEMGGDITIQSAVGHGTTFNITIPS
ncbi:Histidine kinase-, DNA gyrase B-, and HSP90-like ATPase [Pedobacter westerhofensis]|uniref:histidine kinase n=1 Tax=Pedobacter westerhofensis TaxID=425512 RepID=A0A521CAB4_9SPHI|nr:ATP-binding protein [Pedobacter westerhofensis]SMO56305.1 Histidine kinase-, DNA gyrase B-, and HSP90-like ATPase [Pedobacter westerhofensis]